MPTKAHSTTPRDLLQLHLEARTAERNSWRETARVLRAERDALRQNLYDTQAELAAVCDAAAAASGRTVTIELSANDEAVLLTELEAQHAWYERWCAAMGHTPDCPVSAETLVLFLVREALQARTSRRAQQAQEGGR